MAILVISKKKIDFLTLLGRKKEEILLLTSSESFDFYKGDYEYIEGFNNFSNNDALVDRAIDLSKKYDITHVINTSEYEVIKTAIIRDYLNIKGQGIKSAYAFRDKTEMKKYVKSNVKVPAFSAIDSPLDIVSFIDKYQYPVVIKPRDGAGSRNTFIIKNKQELDDVLTVGLGKNYEIEEYVNGKMYTIDGFYKDGKIQFSWAGTYINDCFLSYKVGKRPSYVQLPANSDLSKRLQDYIKILLAALPMPPQTSFHTEVFLTPNDDIILCEIGSRTGGGGTSEMAKHSYGVDLTTHWIKEQCGISDVDSFTRKNEIFGWAKVPPRIGEVKKIPDSIPFPWVLDYKIKTAIGTEFTRLDTVDALAIITVSGTNELEIKGKLDEATEWVENNCEWI